MVREGAEGRGRDARVLRQWRLQAQEVQHLLASLQAHAAALPREVVREQVARREQEQQGGGAGGREAEREAATATSAATAP